MATPKNLPVPTFAKRRLEEKFDFHISLSGGGLVAANPIAFLPISGRRPQRGFDRRRRFAAAVQTIFCGTDPCALVGRGDGTRESSNSNTILRNLKLAVSLCHHV